MAIYSLNHKPIGKQTQQRPYTARAHVNYITRSKAMSHLDGARMPVEREGAGAFFKRAEDAARANGRVADKLMLALPKELTPAQRHELVRGFAEEVTGGRAPWLAAYHDKGKDASNPHCHLIFQDKCRDRGQNKSCSKSYAKTERSGNVMQRGGFFQEVAMA